MPEVMELLDHCERHPSHVPVCRDCYRIRLASKKGTEITMRHTLRPMGGKLTFEVFQPGLSEKEVVAALIKKTTDTLKALRLPYEDIHKEVMEAWTEKNRRVARAARERSPRTPECPSEAGSIDPEGVEPHQDHALRARGIGRDFLRQSGDREDKHRQGHADLLHV
jgi:hypothetical protein